MTDEPIICCEYCGEAEPCGCPDFFKKEMKPWPPVQFDFQTPPDRPSVAFPEDPVVEAVLSRMHDRAKRGMKDYGISMEAQSKPLRQWLDDAIEELLDAALYLEKVKRML